MMVGSQPYAHEHHHAGAGHSSVGHSQAHGLVDPAIATTGRGIWALKWSFAGLMVTALLQVLVVWLSGSVALLADTIHNFGDAVTAIPLWIAFALARLRPSRRFSYGYGRAEDLAGIVVVLTIFSSAIVAGYQAVHRLLYPQTIHYLWAVALASIIGFLGNEAVAIFRIKVGREIGSAALVADGYHARVDGLTSLAVLLGAGGVWLGYSWADPAVGLLISAVIMGIAWSAARAVFGRALDAVEPEVIDELRHAAAQVAGVLEVSEVRARWIGHRLHAEINVAVEAGLTVAAAHEMAKEVRHQALHRLPHLGNAVIHVDPADQLGEINHRIAAHAHDGLPTHAH